MSPTLSSSIGKQDGVDGGFHHFLRVPPFPGAQVTSLEGPSFGQSENEEEPFDLQAVIGLLREHRVGGTYWGDQPELPTEYVLVARPGLESFGDLASGSVDIVAWPSSVTDPWHMLSRAHGLVVDHLDERCAVAAALGVSVFLVDPDTGGCRAADTEARQDLESRLRVPTFINPYDRSALPVRRAIELCGFWRALIESNRDLAGGLGFAFWKQRNVAPLLWDGLHHFRFTQALRDLPEQGKVAIWGSKTPRDQLALIKREGREIVEVEDGFLRSAGLGADCVPPLSITVDRLGPYFDPAVASELELILENAHFDGDLLNRARELRAVIVDAGIGKYERGRTDLPRFGGERVHILVPGQVEDDRSVLTGGAGMTNLELLKRVRNANPEAYIIFKPHPDVEAGHRKGVIPPEEASQWSDRIVTDLPIAALLDLVDEVHVNTSLTGFEALMRGKPVTAHGVPFYAGWGLTNDLGRVPARRSRLRTLDELVAATLLVYPRYLDPVSGLPCPAEIVVQRLIEDQASSPGIVVRLRRWQGKVARQLRALVG